MDKKRPKAYCYVLRMETMMQNLTHQTTIRQKRRITFSFGLLSLLVVISHLSRADSPWVTVYQDHYNYSQQSPKGANFNTWFWREDSAATHEFEVTSGTQCTPTKPCVRLTAQAYPANTAYTNAEMYNNSCIKDAATDVPSQRLATLQESAWGIPLYHRIRTLCNMPYPYQGASDYLTPYGLASSWTTTMPAHLEANPLAFTPADVEAPWKAVRDITFNNPYLATKAGAIRITAEIKAETNDQGGSRGWGFWNTSMAPGFMQLAWFMEYSVPSAYLAKNGTVHRSNRAVVMQTIGRSTDGKSLKICSSTLVQNTHDIYQWHSYRIEWQPEGVQYFVDDQLVADHQGILLDRHMAFHNWVDNRNYVALESPFANFPLTRDKTNVIRDFLVEKAPRDKLPKLSEKGSNSCTTLSETTLLIDVLKALAKDYF